LATAVVSRKHYTALFYCICQSDVFLYAVYDVSPLLTLLLLHADICASAGWCFVVLFSEISPLSCACYVHLGNILYTDAAMSVKLCCQRSIY